VIAERIELKGSDGLTYGVVVDGVLRLPSRQSRKSRTVKWEQWNIQTLEPVNRNESDPTIRDDQLGFGRAEQR
jgi:hypothetical protein